MRKYLFYMSFQKTARFLEKLTILAVLAAMAASFASCRLGEDIDTLWVRANMANREITLLAPGTWADGNITSSDNEQWFKFTATRSWQYIHFSSGTLNNNLYVQVYDSSGSTVGDRKHFDVYYNNIIYNEWYYLTSGQDYYIRAATSSRYSTGTFRIAFNTSSTPPPLYNTQATMLTQGIWADGELTVNGEQWFKFTATASWQYIHFSFGTLYSSDGLYVQVYDSSGYTVRSQTYLYFNTSKYFSFGVTSWQDYYIRVWPYSSSHSGTYRIAVNMSSTPPPITLTVGTWAYGELTSYGEQWFKFTATADTQYIHVFFGTLNDLYVQVYDSSNNTVGSQSNLYNNTKYTSISVTSEQEYYIRVWPYSSGYGGTYRIAFNTSSTPPP
jgi:hypothetical protein